MPPDRDRQLVAAIAGKTTRDEQNALVVWARELLALRGSALSAAAKARRAIALTARSPVVLAAAKLAARELRRHGWENRTWAGRLGLTGAAVGLTLFGGQGAGIAALGTAVGVPLWIVIGSGSAFAGVLIEEFTRH